MRSTTKHLVRLGALLLALGLGAPAHAVKMRPLPAAELVAKSSHVVFGKVLQAEDETSRGYTFRRLTVEVISWLKGRATAKRLRISLRIKGKKAFDPKLYSGDLAIFFLRDVQAGQGRLTYHGSVATFPNAALIR